MERNLGTPEVFTRAWRDPRASLVQRLDEFLESGACPDCDPGELTLCTYESDGPGDGVGQPRDPSRMTAAQIVNFPRFPTLATHLVMVVCRECGLVIRSYVCDPEALKPILD